MSSSNQLPSPSPTPSLILSKFRHHVEVVLPPSLIFPSSSPYLATKTLYHKLPFSSLNLQHHLPIKDKLNSLILLTPKPPSSCLQQIVSQFIQDIFLVPLPIYQIHLQFDYHSLRVKQYNSLFF